jgi:hypothetical protein
VPGLVEQFKPRLKYLLIDENAYSDRELASLNNLVAAVFRIEHPASPAAIGVLLSLLDEWLATGRTCVGCSPSGSGRR